MLIGAFVMTANRRQPVGQAVFGNAVGYPASGTFCISDIDWRAARNGGEHRGDTGGPCGSGFQSAGCGLVWSDCSCASIEQFCEQLCRVDGIGQYLCRSQRISLDDGQPVPTIDQNNTLGNPGKPGRCCL